MSLSDAVESAIAKRQRKLAMSALELALGELVALDGRHEVRRILRVYMQQLRHA